MKRLTDNKILLVVRKTRQEDLKARYGTAGHARFYLKHLGSDTADYEQEHEQYYDQRRQAMQILEEFGRVQVLGRDFLPNFVFGPEDTVVVLGQDGLVANTMKYLDGQPVIGINPDPQRWDGVLLPFRVEDLSRVVPEVFKRRRPFKQVTMAVAELRDGQTLHAVNDLFIGIKGHVSARYEIALGNMREDQSSSGVIVSTGLGSTGWLKSIVTGALGIANGFVRGGIKTKPEAIKSIPWDAQQLVFSVREPYPSRSTNASLIFGFIKKGEPLQIVSKMGENGIIFSDGIESDFLEFNAGMQATIRIADKSGYLVV